MFQQAVLGGGCFWCIEALLKNLKGVIHVIPGYCGGNVVSPKYSDVKKGITGHQQVVKITFNSEQITFQQLLEVFMNIHDPTQEDGQGQDIGSQYLSCIFYQNQNQYEASIKIIRKMGQELKIDNKSIVTILRQAQIFYQAESYHQNYYEVRGKQNPYCDIIPGKIAKMRHLFKEKCKQ